MINKREIEYCRAIIERNWSHCVDDIATPDPYTLFAVWLLSNRGAIASSWRLWRAQSLRSWREYRFSTRHGDEDRLTVTNFDLTKLFSSRFRLTRLTIANAKKLGAEIEQSRF